MSKIEHILRNADAQNNYPAVKQYRLIEQSRDFTLENASKGWLPKISVSAGANAFTDILNTNEQMQQMEIGMKNWMANASVVIRQNVYDGGQIAVQKQVVSAQSEVQKRQCEGYIFADRTFQG